jgi:hypothetical protein
LRRDLPRPWERRRGVGLRGALPSADGRWGFGGGLLVERRWGLAWRQDHLDVSEADGLELDVASAQRERLVIVVFVL